MKDQKPKTNTPSGQASGATPCSHWHVWLVDGHFYAAATLQEARKYSSDQWGTEMDEQQWDDLSCDLVGFHQHATSWDDHDEDNPDCTMRERASEVMEAGESLPFLVGIELN